MFFYRFIRGEDCRFTEAAPIDVRVRGDQFIAFVFPLFQIFLRVVCFHRGFDFDRVCSLSVSFYYRDFFFCEIVVATSSTTDYYNDRRGNWGGWGHFVRACSSFFVFLYSNVGRLDGGPPVTTPRVRLLAKRRIVKRIPIIRPACHRCGCPPAVPTAVPDGIRPCLFVGSFFVLFFVVGAKLYCIVSFGCFLEGLFPGVFRAFLCGGFP